jgi:hypothetical protein
VWSRVSLKKINQRLSIKIPCPRRSQTLSRGNTESMKISTIAVYSTSRR